ncbi:MAG: substrate-binding domain-containing protein [Lachnospiraceae bacterium]|nr:substrate-binding domain-containing protein [Lachnospiraceae bacterium]
MRAEGIKTLLNRNVKMDAIFAFNDMMTIGAIKWLREHGIQVPEDISIIGYDDIFMDEFMDVPLTTIRQPAEEMGRAAARQIINKEAIEIMENVLFSNRN